MTEHHFFFGIAKMAGLNTAVSPVIARLAAEQAAELTTVEAAHVRTAFAPQLFRSLCVRCLRSTHPKPYTLSQVYAVIKQMLEKLALVGVITVDPKVQAQELTQSVGEEITRMIAQQKKLEERFEELVSAQHTLRNLPNKSKLRENQVGMSACMACLHAMPCVPCKQHAAIRPVRDM